MNKFKALLHSWSALTFNGQGALSDTFRVLPASVPGAAGSLFRYVSALLLTAHAVITYDPAAEEPDPTLDAGDLLDVLFGRITWTRYGGAFVPAGLTAREIAVMIGGLGCVCPGKVDLLIHVGAWSNHEAVVYASILIPITYTMYATGKKSAYPEDAPAAAAILGSSSQYTIQHFADIADLDDVGDLTALGSVEAIAMCFDTPDAIMFRPIQYKKQQTSDDPAILPTQFAKLPLIMAKLSDWKAVNANLSETQIPVVRVDGRQMEERLPARCKQVADAWYRDDGDRLFAAPTVGEAVILRSPFEEGKIINQPAGSKWSIEGCAGGQKLDYLYVELNEAEPDLIAYQCSQMGIKPEANTLGNLSINSVPRDGVKLTQEMSLGIPHRLGGTRFKA
jgi:hypothetical protein